MGITLSEISDLMGRYGNKRISEQVNMHAPFATQYIDKVNPGGQVDVINIKAGEIDSVTWVADSGTLPNGHSKQPEQATVLPKFLFGRLTIPRGAATLAAGERDGVNVVFQELDTLGAQLARHLDRGLIKKSVATVTAAQVIELGAIAVGGAGSGNVTFTDTHALRIGTVIERRTSAGVYRELMRVTKIAVDDNGTSHTVTLTRDILAESNNDAAAGDVLYLRGAYANGMVTLDECADETTSVYAHSVNSNDWQGNARTTIGVLDVQVMRDMWTKTTFRGGSQPDFVLGNSRTRQLYSDTLIAQRRFHNGKMDATGGVDIDFEGKPFKVDENVPFDSIYYVKKSDFKLAEWKSFADDGDGGMKRPSDSGHAIVSQSTFDYDHQRWGAYNAHCDRRANLAVLSGITG